MERLRQFAGYILYISVFLSPLVLMDLRPRECSHNLDLPDMETWRGSHKVTKKQLEQQRELREGKIEEDEIILSSPSGEPIIMNKEDFDVR